MRKLTKNQQIVEDYLLAGMSCKEVAYRIGISFEAAAGRKKEVFIKRGVHSVGELLALRFREIMQENKILKLEVENLGVYKKRWEYLKSRAKMAEAESRYDEVELYGGGY